MVPSSGEQARYIIYFIDRNGQNADELLPTQADSSTHVSSWCVPSLHFHVFQSSSSKTKLSSSSESGTIRMA